MVDINLDLGRLESNAAESYVSFGRAKVGESISH